MFEFGAIVLVPFPFTDLSATKVRPALVVSRKPSRGSDVILCFISSKKFPKGAPVIRLAADHVTGLKVPSAVRLDKIATLDRRVILGELGRVPAHILQTHKKSFYRIFGF